MRTLLAHLSILFITPGCLPCTYDEYDPYVRISTWDQAYTMRTTAPPEEGTEYRITPRQVFERSMAVAAGRYCSPEGVAPVVQVNIELAGEPNYEVMRATMTGNVCTAFATAGDLLISPIAMHFEWLVQGGEAGNGTVDARLSKDIYGDVLLGMHEGSADEPRAAAIVLIGGFGAGDAAGPSLKDAHIHVGRLEYPLLRCD